jgi:hypothetical protein
VNTRRAARLRLALAVLAVGSSATLPAHESWLHAPSWHVAPGAVHAGAPCTLLPATRLASDGEGRWRSRFVTLAFDRPAR